MEKIRPSLIFVCGLVCTPIFLGGCNIPLVQAPIPTQSTYIDVEYRRFVSGVYVNELRNKYVKLDCTFSSTMAGSLPRGYSSNNYMSFLALAPESAIIDAPQPTTVVVPRDLADIVFSLRHGDQIQVRGQAIETINRTIAGNVFRSLIIQAHGLQKSESARQPDKPAYY